MTQSTSTLDAQVHHEDASNVQGWEPGLKPSRMRGYSLSDGRRHTRAMLPARLRGVNHKLNVPMWHKPYAEALLEGDSQKSAKLLAATELAIFERLLELSATADASVETGDIRRAIDVMLKLKAKTSSQISTGLSAGTHGIRV
jgi:hypothetical protein